MPVAAGRSAARTVTGNARRQPKRASTAAAGAVKRRAGGSRPVAGSRPAAGSRPRSRPARGEATRALVPVAAGLAWGLALLAAVAAGRAVSWAVLVPVAVVASVSSVKAAGPGTPRRATGRARSGKDGKPGKPARRAGIPLIAAGATAAAVPLAALGGPGAAAAALVVVGGAAVVTLVRSVVGVTARPVRRAGPAVFAALAPAVAASAVVLAGGQGANEAVALVAAVLAYDAGAFMMGHGRTPLGGWFGVAGGVASVAVVAIFVAAVMDPPFSGARPWVLFGLVAALAPAGVTLTWRLAGGARLPALRRLDSLVLAAPVWVLAVAVVLHR